MVGLADTGRKSNGAALLNTHKDAHAKHNSAKRLYRITASRQMGAEVAVTRVTERTASATTGPG
jgi:hypothetical protein